MKQKDVALIMVVAIIAGVVSLFITQTFFVSKKSKELKAEIVEPISSEFKQPDPKIFNGDAVNPTQLIQIGDNSKTTPF